jgi:hypothetical protein
MLRVLVVLVSDCTVLAMMVRRVHEGEERFDAAMSTSA